MPTDSTLLTIIKITAVFVVISFIVFWVGLVWWVAQDVLTRTRDKIIVAVAVAITAILGPVGVVIYLVVRPRQTLKERMGEAMEQEMLMQAGAISVCPNCQSLAQDDFLACPHCGTILKKACDNCGKLLAMDWDHCPFCGQTQVMPTVAEQPVVIEETTTKVYNAAAEPVAEVERLTVVEPGSSIEEISLAAVAQETAKKPAKTESVMDMLRNLFMPVDTKTLHQRAEITPADKPAKAKKTTAKKATKSTKPTKSHPTRSKKAAPRGKKS